jgi:hypothetical protein
MNTGASDAGKSGGPDCKQCVYFAVTWDQDFPYRCNAMGFYSRELPSVEVFIADGRHCLAFQDKRPVEKKQPASGASYRGKNLDIEC